MNYGDGCRCGGGGNVGGNQSFSGYADSKCSSGSSLRVSPAHLGSPGCEALWQGWGPGPARYRRPESDAFPPSYADALDFSAPSAPALHSPVEKDRLYLYSYETQLFLKIHIFFFLDILISSNLTWTAFWKRRQNKWKTLQASSNLKVLSSSQKNSTRAWLDILIPSTSSSASFRRSSAIYTQTWTVYTVIFWNSLQHIFILATNICGAGGSAMTLSCSILQILFYTSRKGCVCCWISASVWMFALRATTLLFNLNRSSSTDSSHNLGRKVHTIHNDNKNRAQLFVCMSQIWVLPIYMYHNIIYLFSQRKTL